MRKFIIAVSALCLALVSISCATSSGIPSKIENARRKAPKDVLVGIGNAKMGTDAQSRTIAATRARTELSNSMNSIVRDMIHNYTASSEVDPQTIIAFQENITVTLSQSNIRGAVIVEETKTEDDTWWCVMYLSKADIVREINQAQAAAKLAVPAMVSFNAEDRMNEAFERAAKEAW